MRPTPSLHAGFTFDDAAAAAKHLADLGVTHAYCSPYPHAAEGSSQRYVVIDHSTVNRELGGEEGSSMGSATARQQGRGCAAQGPEALHGHWRRLQEHVTMLSEAEGAHRLALRSLAMVRLVVTPSRSRTLLCERARALTGARRNCAPDCALTGVYPRQTPSLTGEYRGIVWGAKLLKRLRKECLGVLRVGPTDRFPSVLD